MKTGLSNQVDVLVIGSGFAGLSAAIEAAEAGASVQVLEKMRAPGGNSAISDGGIAAPMPVQTGLEGGVHDSAVRMYQDMLTAGEGLNHPDLLRCVTEGAWEAFVWSRDVLGVPYKNRIDIFGGHSVARCYTPETISGRTLIQRQLLRLEALHVPVKTGILVTSVIQDACGRVTGVRVLEDYRFGEAHQGVEKDITAKFAVVVASGGFSSDVAFRMAQDPRLDQHIGSTNKASATAEVLRECLRIGANPVHLDKIQLGPWASPDEKGFGVGPLFGDYVALPYGMVVDPATGNRFVNELADRKTVSDAILKCTHPAIGLADQAGVDHAGWDLGKAIGRGIVKAFPDLNAIASEYGINADILVSSVGRFNEQILSGSDTDFGKSFPSGTAPIRTPPYFAMRLWPKVHHTMGGIQIDSSARVLDREQHPIPGLFAAGEVTGGVHGACRLGSCAITECLVMGRIAGKEAVRAGLSGASGRSV